MTATDILRHEHQIILLVLDGVEREAERIRETGTVRADKVAEMVDFFRAFADRCHHQKEEKLLFVRMRERGMPGERGPIASMLHEHDQGRALVSAIAEALPKADAGDPEAIDAVHENLRAYAAFLRAHIDKEDNVLFPVADQLFTARDQELLVDAFEQVEAEEIGEGVHDRYHRWAHDLAG
jgi:hemerythrin-like domain-containing protein